jgi:hypothetical protein
MRTLIFTLSLIITMVSCASISKMVRSGQYDEAFNYAISKIRRGHTLNAEHINGLEVAFEKLNNRDLRTIEDLISYDKERNLDKVLSIYRGLEHRNRLVHDLSPIRSKEGHVAKFELADYSLRINETIDDICLYKYTKASDLINLSSKNGQKDDAKLAYRMLEEVEILNAHYKDSRRLKDKAYDLGVTTVSLAIDNDLNGHISNDIVRKIKNMPLSRLDSKWYDFTRNFEDARDADLTIVVNLRDLDLGREFERVNNYQESREILVRTEKKIVKGKDHHNDKKDTSRVYIEKEIFQKVDAFVTEVFRERDAALRGTIKVVNNHNRSTIHDTPILVNHNFRGYGCRYVGDDRALTDQTKCKLDTFLEEYPHDYAIVDVLSDAFADAVMRESKKIAN